MLFLHALLACSSCMLFLHALLACSSCMLFLHALPVCSSCFLTVHRALHALASRDPADVVLRWLREEFAAGRAEDGFSLAIDAGRGGARLTHSHTRQVRPLGVHTEIPNKGRDVSD
jgi:hypothetical protein